MRYFDRATILQRRVGFGNGVFLLQMARIHQRHDMDCSSMLFCLIKTPAPGITSLSVTTGRVSLAVPLFVHGFFFAVWHLHRLTNGGDSVSKAKMEFACNPFFFRDAIPTFSSHWRWSSCIHANSTQLERQVSLRMTRKTRRVLYLSPMLSVLPSFSVHGMGGTGVLFGSCLRAPATSTLLFLLAL